MVCTQCGEPMRMTDKNTFTGRDIREYKCDRCGHEDWEDRGTALWQILHDDREESEAARAAAANPVSPLQAPDPAQQPPGLLWRRLAGFFRKVKQGGRPAAG
jgi:DNA-directed RNA polymerase subunit RPC12/RpoP